jgi:hypothetical protein
MSETATMLAAPAAQRRTTRTPDVRCKCASLVRRNKADLRQGQARRLNAAKQPMGGVFSAGGVTLHAVALRLDHGVHVKSSNDAGQRLQHRDPRARTVSHVQGCHW